MHVFAKAIHYDHDNIFSFKFWKAFYEIHIDVNEWGERDG
jgi:hypothetical protein